MTTLQDYCQNTSRTLSFAKGGICCRIAVPEGTIAPVVNNSYIIGSPDSKGLDYLIPLAEDSIIVGGANRTFRPFRGQWSNDIDDNVLIEATNDY
jgi:hypothetical protein